MIELRPEPDSSQAVEPRVSVSVVVVSFNTKDMLRGCLKSIEELHGDVSVEIIVVDNASADGSAEMVSTSFPKVVLIRNANNRGFGAAVNQGLRAGIGEFFMLLNSDAVLISEALAGMAACLITHPAVGLIGCRLVDESGGAQPSASDLPSLWMELASFYSLKSLMPSWALQPLLRSRIGAAALRLLSAGHVIPRLAKAVPVEVEFLSGACIMMRRKVWSDIGDFDENIFLYLEDADWCRRAAQAGWKLAYVPQFAVVHRGGESFKALSRGLMSRVSRERCRSLIYYFRKHKTTSEVFLLKGIIISSVLFRLLALQLRGFVAANNQVERARQSALYRRIISETVSG